MVQPKELLEMVLHSPLIKINIPNNVSFPDQLWNTLSIPRFGTFMKQVNDSQLAKTKK